MQKKKIIHGDIKSENILINFKNTNTPFCLIDFESLCKPDKITCENDLPCGYYYYALGCESDKPYYSYRMDLQAFGIILWNLTLSVENFYKFDWQDRGNYNYNKRKNFNEFKYLNALRNINGEKNDLIKNYFEIIEKVDWYDTEVDPDIYKKIKDLVKLN